MSVKSFYLKVISPVLVAGELIESGEVIEVLEHEAKALLSRKKVLLATDEDIADTDSGSTPDREEITGETGPADESAPESLKDPAEAKGKGKGKK